MVSLSDLVSVSIPAFYSQDGTDISPFRWPSQASTIYCTGRYALQQPCCLGRGLYRSRRGNGRYQHVSYLHLHPGLELIRVLVRPRSRVVDSPAEDSRRRNRYICLACVWFCEELVCTPHALSFAIAVYWSRLSCFMKFVRFASCTAVHSLLLPMCEEETSSVFLFNHFLLHLKPSGDGLSS